MLNQHSRPKAQIPAGACDCHMHVFGSLEEFPPVAERSYTPRPASLAQYEAIAETLGLERIVFVQASAYGTDNRCMLAAMKDVGERCRGVAVVDASITDEEIQHMHDIGVRGIRLNMKSTGRDSADGIAEVLEWAARRLAPLGWHVQLFAELATIAGASKAIRAAEIPVVIDHMGMAKADLGVEQSGFSSLLDLLADEKCWVKVSGAYRVSSREDDFSDSIPIARALIDANDRRVVWGSDWPHTGKHAGKALSGPPLIEYRDLDDGVLLDLLAASAGNLHRLKLVLVDNPAALYDFPAI
jgi:predicted TIM-barrel fold metal-dependent hydrolase